MIKANEKKRKKEIENNISKVKLNIKNKLLKYKKQIISISVLFIVCITFLFIVLPNANVTQFIAFNNVTSNNLNRLSEDAFRKIIGFDYTDKIYIKDTAEIRNRMENNNMVFGKVKFFVSLVPYNLEIKFNEAEPLFFLMNQNPNIRQTVYSDKGEIYPYKINTYNLPVVEATKESEIDLATSFLVNMKENDFQLYSRVSQVILKESEKQIIVFFSDTDFKTKFSLESSYWKIAFKHYRQLTRNMNVLNINSISILDLRFKQLAFTTEKQEKL